MIFEDWFYETEFGDGESFWLRSERFYEEFDALKNSDDFGNERIMKWMKDAFEAGRESGMNVLDEIPIEWE